MEKLKGNQNVREDLTGQFASEANAGKPGFNVETDEPQARLNVWMEKYLALGAEYQRAVTDRKDAADLFGIADSIVEHLKACE
jgi:hypothetical protein